MERAIIGREKEKNELKKMKQQNKHSFICRLAAVLAFLMAISIDCAAAIKAGDAEVNVNSTTTISLAATYQTTLKRSTNVTYRWSTTSTNLSVTSQSAYSCTVKGLSAGTAQVDYHCSYFIDGYYRTMDFYYTVTVKGGSEPLTITPTSISLTYIGQTYTVKATQNGTVGGVYFVSNNENVAEVSVDYNSGYSTYGTVTAIGPGTTYIYAKNMKGDTSTMCTVTVTIPKQYQSLSLSSLPAMTYGDSWRQLPTTTDEGLSLSWSSNNSSVASISSGKLYVRGAGQATITASNSGNSSYYAFSRSYTLNVSKASLTITANDCTKPQGEENPELTVTYSGFKNNDDASVLTTLPTVTTTATKDSPAGTYPITVSGASAANYDMTYVGGTLTVIERKACAMPTIGYAQGKLTFRCETDDVTFNYDIADDDVKVGQGNEVNLTATYHISVYASKEGYADSEVATATLCWVESDPQMEGMAGEDDATDIKALPVLIKSQGGTIMVQGVADGSEVHIYNVGGILQGSAFAKNGTAAINTTLGPGSIAVLKVGNRSVKITIR